MRLSTGQCTMDEPKFRMTEPRENRSNRDTRYSFWLTTAEVRLFEFVKSLPCVASVRKLGESRGLIAIGDEYDADEAWHFIRSELEYEAQFVPLDKIWEDAMMWL